MIDRRLRYFCEYIKKRIQIGSHTLYNTTENIHLQTFIYILPAI